MIDTSKKTVLSAIQPTGDIHLGNYFGAVQNWVKLQQDYNCIYGIVDYHAMTMPYKANDLRRNVWQLIFNLISVGVKPENLFIQSLIPEHTELCWIFNCFCSYGQLQRMTQFKDKSSQVSLSSKENFVSVGLLDYPVLQSADILIYKADFVPVGKDQDQHLELTRDIAERFNFQVGKEYFVLPQALYTETPKILSLADPSRKMSKSAGEKHYISLFCDENILRKQIRSAITDIGNTNKDSMSPGIKNLFQLIKAAGDIEIHDQLMADYLSNNLKYIDLKEATLKSLVPMISKFKENKSEVLSNKKEIKKSIKDSSYQIRKIAQETLREVKDLTGLLNVKYN